MKAMTAAAPTTTVVEYDDSGVKNDIKILEVSYFYS
jgi:hypothetical protein